MRTFVELLAALGFATCEICLKGKRAVRARIPILAAVVLLSVLPAVSFAQTATNDFEDGTGHDVIIPASHYAGTTFSNAVWASFGGKGLGVDLGVIAGNNWAFPGTSSPIVVSFDLPMNSVSITVRDVGDNGAQLEAFFGAGSVGVDNAVASPGPITVELTVNAASIDRIELSQHLTDETPPIHADGVIFDDLIYTQASAVPAGTVVTMK